MHSPPHAQIIKVGIAEAGTLRGLVDKIFDKALTDPEAQRTLAELCTVMPAHVSRWCCLGGRLLRSSRPMIARPSGLACSHVKEW